MFNLTKEEMKFAKRDLAFLKRVEYFHKFHGEDARCPCSDCPHEMTCELSWDIYNTDDGECLCDK
jgi:hypothetical protein